MAILKTVIINDVTIPNAYIKVDLVIADKNTARASIQYHALKESECFFGKEVSFPLDLEGSNPIKQAYNYIKMLPEFAGAIDC